MSTRKQWLLSVLIVLLTALWWVGRDSGVRTHDRTTAALPPVAASATRAADPASGEPEPAATDTAEPLPGVTNHPLPTTRLLPAVHATTSGAHAFLSTNTDGTPVTWSPCSPIHYTVNSDEMPANGLSVLHAAIDQVSAASGLRFVQDPETHDKPSKTPAGLAVAADGTYVPVLIAWTTKQEFPELGDAAGVTSPVWRDLGGGHVAHYRQYFEGQVVLDATYYRQIAAQGWSAEEQAILMHELGHLVGLGHVHTDSELMNQANVGLLHFGPGDLQGWLKPAAVAALSSSATAARTPSRLRPPQA